MDLGEEVRNLKRDVDRSLREQVSPIEKWNGLTDAERAKLLKTILSSVSWKTGWQAVSKNPLPDPISKSKEWAYRQWGGWAPWCWEVFKEFLLNDDAPQSPPSAPYSGPDWADDDAWKRGMEKWLKGESQIQEIWNPEYGPAPGDMSEEEEISGWWDYMLDRKDRLHILGQLYPHDKNLLHILSLVDWARLPISARNALRGFYRLWGRDKNDDKEEARIFHSSFASLGGAKVGKGFKGGTLKRGAAGDTLEKLLDTLEDSDG